LHARNRCEKEVVERLAIFLSCRKSQIFCKDVSPDLMTYFSLYGDCVNSEELLFDKAIAFKGNMVVKVFGRLVLVEPESRAHKSIFRDTTITVG